MDRPIAAFDIETIPDPGAGRSVLGLTGDDADVIEAMLARRLEETDGRSDFHTPPFHRVVAVAVAWLDPASGVFRLGCPAPDADDERALVEGFFSLFEGRRTAPRLVSWNGSGFDLPVLRYRAMVHGVAAPDFHRTDGDRKWNNYQNRFHDMHVDLMDVLAGYGASPRVGLDDLCRIVGLAGKTLTHGHKVHGHILAGEDELVRTYCEIDALNTLLLYLLWSFHCGRLDRDGLRRHLEGIGGVLSDGDAAPAWRAVGAALESWPEWLSGGRPGRD